MTNTKDTKTTTITIEVGRTSPIELANAIRTAILSLPDEPIDYVNDPMWDGVPVYTAPLTNMDGLALGTMKISTGTVYTCHCGQEFFDKEGLFTHQRATHVETLYMVPASKQH